VLLQSAAPSNDLPPDADDIAYANLRKEDLRVIGTLG